MNQLPDLHGCGAAFLLHAPPTRTVTWPHADGTVAVRHGAAYLTVEHACSVSEIAGSYRALTMPASDDTREGA